MALLVRPSPQGYAGDMHVVDIPDTERRCLWWVCANDGTVFAAEPLDCTPHRVFLVSTSGQIIQRLENTQIFGSGTNLVALIGGEEIGVVVAGQVYSTGARRSPTLRLPVLAANIDVRTSLQKTRIDSQWLYWSDPYFENHMGITPDWALVYGSRWKGVTIEHTGRRTINMAPRSSGLLTTITSEGNVVSLFYREKGLRCGGHGQTKCRSVCAI